MKLSYEFINDTTKYILVHVKIIQWQNGQMTLKLHRTYLYKGVHIQLSLLVFICLRRNTNSWLHLVRYQTYAEKAEGH